MLRCFTVFAKDLYSLCAYKGNIIAAQQPWAHADAAFCPIVAWLSCSDGVKGGICTCP